MNYLKQTWWETASNDEIHHRQGTLLRQFLKHRVVPFSRHYAGVFAELDLDPEDIRSTDDLVKIPFTSKSNLIEPRDFVIIPDEAKIKRQWSTLRKVIAHGPAETKRLLEVEHRPVMMTSTTGRSSQPVPFMLSQYDIDRLTESGRRLMNICKSQTDFRHINAFPFAPHLAFWQAHYASIGFTTFMLSTGGGKVMGTHGNIKLIDKINPEAIIAMPTFLYHILQEAADKGSQWPKLKKLVLGGEKVPAGMRRKIHDLCDAVGARDVEIFATYAFTEAKMAWTECGGAKDSTPSGYHLFPDMGFVEIIDPDTGERVPDGEPGEIVFTPIDARGSVVLRYRTGDIIDGGITREPCPHCHRTCPRLVGNISRVSDVKRLNIDKIKGTLVDFSALETLLDDNPGLGAWQLEIRKRNDDPHETDIVIVHAVALNNDRKTLSDEIVKSFEEHTEFHPNDIQWHSWSEMKKLHGVGKELKEEKFVDHRPSTNQP